MSNTTSATGQRDTMHKNWMIRGIASQNASTGGYMAELHLCTPPSVLPPNGEWHEIDIAGARECATATDAFDFAEQRGREVIDGKDPIGVP